MAPHRSPPATVVMPVDGGVAEMRADRAGGWLLVIDGVPQSFVDPADPERMVFTYVQSIALILRARRPAPAPMTVLHLGGGALALPRLVAHWWPGSVQRVADHDAALQRLVARVLPPVPGTEVEIGDARAVLEAAAPGSYDVIVADVFTGATSPRSVTTTGFAAAARRALRPDGMLVTNLMDVPPAAWTRVQTATQQAVFDDVCLLADRALLRGRTAGNAVLAAAADLGDLPVKIGGLRGPELTALVSGARARLDDDP